jgi:hypothetical protein
MSQAWDLTIPLPRLVADDWPTEIDLGNFVSSYGNLVLGGNPNGAYVQAFAAGR